MLYSIIIIVWILIGIFFKYKKPKKNNFKGKNFSKTNPVLVSNFIGNEILCQTLTIIIYLLTGYNNTLPYICASLMCLLALVLHIHDITGKSIETIVDKLQFNTENIKINIFVRITLFFSIIILLIGLILPRLIN